MRWTVHSPSWLVRACGEATVRRLAALTNRGVLLSVHASVYALRLRVDGGRRATSFLLSGLRLHLYCRFHIRVLAFGLRDDECF